MKKKYISFFAISLSLILSLILAPLFGGAQASTTVYGSTFTSGGTHEVVVGDTANSESAILDIDSVPMPNGRFVNGYITFTLTGNSVVSAIGVCKVYIKR